MWLPSASLTSKTRTSGWYFGMSVLSENWSPQSFPATAKAPSRTLSSRK